MRVPYLLLPLALLGLLFSCGHPSKGDVERQKKLVASKILEIRLGTAEREVTRLFGLPYSQDSGPFESKEGIGISKSPYSTSPCSLATATRRNNYIVVLRLPYPEKGYLVHYINVYFDKDGRATCAQADLNTVVDSTE